MTTAHLENHHTQPSSWAFWYALPVWVAYGALAPVAVYSFVNLVVVLLVCALGVHGWRGLSRTVRGIARAVPPELASALALWLVLTCLWAVQPVDALSTLAKLAVLMVAAIAAWSAIESLTHRNLRLVQKIIAGGAGLLCAIYAFEIIFAAPIATAVKEIYMGDLGPGIDDATRAMLIEERAHQKIARGMVALGALSFPVGYFIWRRTKSPLFAGLWWVGCLIVAFAAHMSSVPVAMVAALLPMIWIWRFPRHGLMHMAGLACAFILAVPLIAQQIDRPERLGIEGTQLDVSSQHRIQIYHYTANLIMERPLTGWGFRAARNMSDQAPAFVAAGYSEPFNAAQTILPLHPHNMALQIWLETGFVGVVLLSMLILIAVARISAARLSKTQRVMIGGTAGFLFVIANISFGIWQFHWLALMALTAGAVLAFCHRPRPIA